MVARPTGRRGCAAGSAERAVGGGFDTLTIERRRACRATRRRLAGPRADGLLAARSGRVRPDMGHLRADNGEPGPPLWLAATGRCGEDNHRTVEWAITNGPGTSHATNFLERRTSEVRGTHLPRPRVNKPTRQAS